MSYGNRHCRTGFGTNLLRSHVYNNTKGAFFSVNHQSDLHQSDLHYRSVFNILLQRMSLSTTKVVFLWFNLHDLKRFWPHKYLTSLTTILIFSILKIISCRKAIQTFLSETVNLSDETRSKYWSYTIPSCINCSRSYMAAFRHCSSSLLSSV